MNIVIINHYAGSPTMGMEYRPYYLAKNWCEMGHKVLIVAASASHLRRKNISFPQDYKYVPVEGIDFLFIRTDEYSKNNSARAKNTFQFLKGVWRLTSDIAKKFTPDIVIASSTYPFDIYPASKLAKMSGAKLIYEIHDLWPLSLELLHGYTQSHPLIKAVNLAQRKAVRKANMVVSILPKADDYLAEKGLSPKAYRYIPNGIETDTSDNSKAILHITTLQKYKASGRFTVIYLGGFACANALEDFVLAARQLPLNVQLILVGDGGEGTRLKRLAAEKSITNVLFLPSIAKSCVHEVLSLADCLYIGAQASPLYSYGIGMNKLYDYMLSARPVICGIETVQNPLEQADCGVIIEPESSMAIAQAVLMLREMSEQQRAEMGERGRKYVLMHHDYKNIAAEFLACLTTMEKGDEIC